MLRTLLALCMTGLLMVSCEKNKEPFYQVDVFETALHNQVNKYRQSQELSDLVFSHDIFIEARQQSLAWKNSGDPASGLDARMQTIQEHWEPTMLGVITAQASSKDTAVARLVVESWVQDTTARSIITDDYVQSGPGIAVGEGGEVYITHFFMTIPD